MRHLQLFALCLLVSTFCAAQPGYDIRFKITGLKDTIVHLGHFYGEATYIKDTAHVNSQGEFAFEGKKTLRQGVYFLVLGKNKQFDMVIGNDKQFSMTTNREEYVKNMVVTGDEDNKLFFENMVFNMERHKEAEPYIKVIQDSTLVEDKKKDARNGFSKINDKVNAFQAELISKHPTTLTARIIKSNQSIIIPELPKKSDGSVDSTFQLKWY